jgi:hypothetical protein
MIWTQLVVVFRSHTPRKCYCLQITYTHTWLLFSDHLHTDRVIFFRSLTPRYGYCFQIECKWSVNNNTFWAYVIWKQQPCLGVRDLNAMTMSRCKWWLFFSDRFRPDMAIVFKSLTPREGHCFQIPYTYTWLLFSDHLHW